MWYNKWIANLTSHPLHTQRGRCLTALNPPLTNFAFVAPLTLEIVPMYHQQRGVQPSAFCLSAIRAFELMLHCWYCWYSTGTVKTNNVIVWPPHKRIPCQLEIPPPIQYRTILPAPINLASKLISEKCEYKYNLGLAIETN